MRNFLWALFFLLPSSVFSQYNETTIVLLKKLDSIRTSTSVSRHFGELYFNVTAGAVDYFATTGKPVQNFMQRLEQRFADYFFTAANLFNQKKDVPVAWKTYYSDTSRTRIQFFLLGANAHINGDIWQAVTSEFSLEELKTFRKSYYRYNKKLKEQLLDIYREAFESVPKVRLLHTATLGLDKQYVKLMLVRWRKRQIKLSMLWFTDKDHFQTKLTSLRKKMEKLDKLVLQNL